MAISKTRPQRSYDHRLRDLVRATGDPNVVAEFGVPRSTASGWLRGEQRRVISSDVVDMDHVRLQTEVLKLRQRIRRLGAVIRLLLALVRTLGAHLDHARLPEGGARARLLRAIERAESVLSLRGALRILHLSPARYYQWRQVEQTCGLEDQVSCPRSTPTRLTAEEILTIKDMVMSPEFRHVSTGRLAVLAQRLGRVFAAPATWYKLVRERAWRRPRMRVHPQRPKEGVRATEPDELWHVDTTIIKLIDGTKVYLHAVIDNFSRRILSWLVTERFEFATTVAILQVASHNDEIPHSAFRGQTPNEVYYGRGEKVPEQLEAARQQARAARLRANRERSCQQCGPPAGTLLEAPIAA